MDVVVGAVEAGVFYCGEMGAFVVPWCVVRVLIVFTRNTLGIFLRNTPEHTRKYMFRIDDGKPHI